MWVTLSLLIALGGPAQAGDAPSPKEATMAWSDLSLTSLDGTPLAADALAGKVVLFVNVASRCGYTSQYKGLQALYEARKDDGLVIVGVPCNQFGGQEPGSAEEIVSFCQQNFGVSFPLLEKQKVNGPKRSELYQRLVASEVGAGGDVRWNFEKFVVDPSGASEYVVSLQLIADGGALAFSRIVLVDARRSASDSDLPAAAAANGLAPATRSPLGATSNAHRSP